MAEPQHIDFKLPHTPLMVAFANIASHLETENRPEYPPDFHSILRAHITVANHTYQAIRHLVLADWTYTGEAKVLCRSMLDGVYTVALLCADPKKYTSLYTQSGFREQAEFYSRQAGSQWMQEHGQDWLDEFRQFLTSKAGRVNVEDESVTEPSRTVQYFPHAAQIIKGKSNVHRESLSPSLVSFLTKLYEEYYSPLSQYVHLSDSGLAGRGVFLLYATSFQQRKEQIISEPVGIAMLSMLSTLHEINHALGYDMGAKLKEAWTYLALTVPLFKELYESHYQSL